MTRPTFNPDTVLLSDSIGKEFINPNWTDRFVHDADLGTSLLERFGNPVQMDSNMKEMSTGLDELSDAYFVDEGERIGTASIGGGSSWILKSKKIGVILPVTEEFLSYTWSEYFEQIVPKIREKFNMKIDGSAFLGLHGNPFQTTAEDGTIIQGNVLGAATTAGNIIEGDLTTNNIYDLEDVTETEPNGFVGHRTLRRSLRELTDGGIDMTLADGTTVRQGGSHIFEPATDGGLARLDGLGYRELVLGKQNGARIEYPEGTLLTGNFDNLIYGIPKNKNLRLSISDQATLSTVEASDLAGEAVGLWERDMKALRAIFEIAVAIPNNNDFAVLQPDVAGV